MDSITNLLSTHNYKLISQESSKNFGDGFEIFSNNNMCFRISTSRSVFSIDVSTIGEVDCWHDLALVKSFLYSDNMLNKPFKREDYISFLMKEIEIIKQIFDPPNYPNTKLKLEELEKERVKQMFPGV